MTRRMDRGTEGLRRRGTTRRMDRGTEGKGREGGDVGGEL